MDFTFRQLEIFVEAAKDENFRATADRLGITQPSISNHIRALERKAGGKLFDRNRGSSARLLPLGRDVLEQARLVLREAAKVRRTGNADMAAPVLRVAIGPYLVDQLLRPLLPDYHAGRNVPDLELVVAGPGREMTEMLRKGQVDLALYTGMPLEEPGFVTEVVRRVTVGLYGSPNLAGRLTPMQDLNEAPIIMAPAHSAVDGWLRAMLKSVGISPRNIIARSQFPDVVLNLVLKGKGLALLFDDEVADLQGQGRLVRLSHQFEPSFRCMTFAESGLDGTLSRGISRLKSLMRGAA